MKKLLPLFLVLTLCVLLACEGKQGSQGPTGPQGPAGPEKIYVYGMVENTGWTWVGVYYAPVIPQVTVNQNVLPIYDWWEDFCFVFHDSIQISPGDSAHLKVDYTQRIATASAKVPGNFEITSHDASAIAFIPVDANFTVSWSASNYTEFYWVDFWLEYNYYDTLGNPKYFSFEEFGSQTSTSITFLASELFPRDFDYIYSQTQGSWGYFDVYAVNGPEIESGSEGNVTGDGTGFFWGGSYKYLYVRIEGTKLSSPLKVGKDLSREELTRRRLEKLKELDPKYQALKEAWSN